MCGGEGVGDLKLDTISSHCRGLFLGSSEGTRGQLTRVGTGSAPAPFSTTQDSCPCEFLKGLLTAPATVSWRSEQAWVIFVPQACSR